MKNRFNKFFAIVLAFVLFVGIVPIEKNVLKASAEDNSCFVSDVIEFGSYPQSQVTNENTLISLNSLISDSTVWTSYGYCFGSGSDTDGRISTSGFMRYKDVVLDGNKYRAVYFNSYRPSSTWERLTTESTYQDNNGYYLGNIYWFEYEPIKWRVLDAQTGLLMSDIVLDSQAYNNYVLKYGEDSYGNEAYWGTPERTYYANNYESSSIRNWLNDDFYNTAFSEKQMNCIKTSTLDNKASNEVFSEYDSADTNDKVFLLSTEDVINVEFGFSDNGYPSSTRYLQKTDYAQCQGLNLCSEPNKEYYENPTWLIRSAGCNSKCICYINVDGAFHNNGKTTDTSFGVVPAIYVDTNGVSEYLNFEQKTIEFGSYPQKRIYDEHFISELNKQLDNNSWTSYPYYSGSGSWGGMAVSQYMYYEDISYEDNLYRAVKISGYRPDWTFDPVDELNSSQRDNGLVVNEVYWYKFEPLEWIILDESNGFVICKNVIDAQPFNNTIYFRKGEEKKSFFKNVECSIFACDYSESSLRNWLNTTFLYSAFSSNQIEAISTSTYENNGCYTIGGVEGYEFFDFKNTKDKISLMSYSDIVNSSFEFDIQKTLPSAGTDYAKAQGLYTNRNQEDDYYANSSWLLRSAGTDSDMVCFVTPAGTIVSANWYTFNSNLGVRPVMHIDRSLLACEHNYECETILPTCLADGKSVYTCSKCNDQYEEIIPALGHDYIVKYSWSGNGTYCNATATCKRDANHIESESGSISSEVKVPADCNRQGITSYTATFTNKIFSTHTIEITDIPALGHKWKYSTDKNSISVFCTDCHEIYTVTANVPQNCKCSDETKNIIVTGSVPEEFVTSISYQTADGNVPKTAGTYTAYFDLRYNGLDDSVLARVELPIVITHDVVSHEGKKVTCDEDGWNEYETCRGCDYSTYKLIPALGHDYVASYEWSEDGKTCTAVAICSHDASHTFSENGVITSKVKVKPACLKMGTTTYSAGFNNKFFFGQTKDVVDIPATGHSFTNYVYQNDATVNSDGTERAYCDHEGCNAVDVRTATGTKLKTEIHIRSFNKFNGTTQKYKTSITFFYDITNDSGNKVEWRVNGADFTVNSDGSCTVKQATGDYTIYCQIKDTNGNTIKSEEETVHIKNGLFDKLIAFFRNLFGKLDVYKQD